MPVPQPEVLLPQPPLSVEGLAGMLAVRTQGVTGPERANAPHVFEPATVMSMLDPEASQWPAAEVVVDGICTTYNKLIDRQNVPVQGLPAGLPGELADKISQIAYAAEYPTSGQSVQGLRRLVENSRTEDATYYLSEDFVYELQDIAGEEQNPRLYHAVGNFFTVKELLRRAVNNKNALDDVRESVEKAAEITQDTTVYVERITGEIADKTFVRNLTPTTVLYLTSRFPRSTDFAVEHIAKYYRKLAQSYPRVVEADSSSVLNMLLRRGTSADAFEKTDAIVAAIDKQLLRAEQEGLTNRMAVQHIARFGRGDESHYRETVLAIRERKALENRYSPHNGPLTQRTKAAVEKGVIPREAFGALEHGRFYRDLLFDISEAVEPEQAEAVKQLFVNIEATKVAANRLGKALPVGTDGYSTGIRKGLSERMVQVLGSLPGSLAGESQTAEIYHGTVWKGTERIKNIQEIYDTAKLLRFMVEQVAAAHEGGFSESQEDPLVGRGRFVSHAAPVSVSVRPEETDEGEARVAWKVKMSPEHQQAVLGRVISRKSLELAMRLDFERATGQPSLDIGGLMDFAREKQPLNEMIARVITVGAQTLARNYTGDTDLDYHVREVFAPELADPLVFRRFANSVMYQLELDSGLAVKIPRTTVKPAA